MADGNWKAEVQLPKPNEANRNRIIAIDHAATFATELVVNGQKVKVARGFKTNYVSDGTRWNELGILDRGVERKPQLFGVPVVTLLGYTIPTKSLQSYVYPALHGACGFCYSMTTMW